MDPIIIIGSGLGGLALAQGLHKSKIPFKIFERDLSHSIRRQGYRIRLHGEGLHALRSLLKDEIWSLFMETCAETVLGPLPNIDAQTCEISVAEFGGHNPQVRISQSTQEPSTVDRGVLREVLTSGLDKDIVYGKMYTDYVPTETGIIARFADGTLETGSLLVGADGVASAVRRQYLPHLRVLDTRTRPIYGKTPLTESLRKHMLPEAMKCLSLVKDAKTNHTTLVEAIRFLPKDQRKDQRDLPQDYVYWAIIPPALNDPSIGAQPKVMSGREAAELAKTTTSHWHSALRPLIELQDSSQTGMFRLLSFDPESLKQPWEADVSVTLIGDAVHAMLPSTASGAVTTLRDAELLCNLIKDQGVSAETIANYEEQMRSYASEAVASSATIGLLNFGMRALADSEVVSW